MRYKQIICWTSVAIGIILVILALHSIHESQKPQTVSEHIHAYVIHLPFGDLIIKFFGNKPPEELPQRNISAMVTGIVGVILIAVGGVVAYLTRKRK